MQGEASPDTPASTEILIELPQVKEEKDVKEEPRVDGSGKVVPQQVGLLVRAKIKISLPWIL